MNLPEMANTAGKWFSQDLLGVSVSLHKALVRAFSCARLRLSAEGARLVNGADYVRPQSKNTVLDLFPARNKMMAAYTSGPKSTEINAINTSMGHVGVLGEA